MFGQRQDRIPVNSLSGREDDLFRDRAHPVVYRIGDECPSINNSRIFVLVGLSIPYIYSLTSESAILDAYRLELAGNTKRRGWRLSSSCLGYLRVSVVDQNEDALRLHSTYCGNGLKPKFCMTLFGE